MNFQWISKLTYTLSFKSTSFVENDLPEKRKMLHFDLNMIERESKYWIWNLLWFQACGWAFMFCSAIPKLFYWFLTFYTVTIKYWTKEQENHNFLIRFVISWSQNRGREQIQNRHTRSVANFRREEKIFEKRLNDTEENQWQ